MHEKSKHYVKYVIHTFLKLLIFTTVLFYFKYTLSSICIVKQSLSDIFRNGIIGVTHMSCCEGVLRAIFKSKASYDEM